MMTLRRDKLVRDGLFDQENARHVTDWLVGAEGLRPVVLVGAGFSLNARNLHTGAPVTTAEVPLWSHIVSALADEMDLPVDARAYDAPTMAELYHEHFKNRLVPKLHSLLLDDDIRPDAAHGSLASYDAEAIITTNLLDTLLDKTGRYWNQVVEDSELRPTVDPHGIRRTDLIYLHGHRARSQTWVITRSQYEDIYRTRPLILARVRQLLAQHPLLVVGYSLSDPDLHAVYRHVGRRLRNQQPRGLAILVSPSAPAEQQHWERLGIKCVVLTRPSSGTLGDAFAKLFPSLRPSWNPSREDIRAHVLEGPKPADRLTRFYELDPLGSGDGRRATVRARFEAWRDVLFSLVDDARIAALRQLERDTTRDEFEARRADVNVRQDPL